MDRGYAAMELMRGIISAESSFVLRIRDNSRFEVIEERELSKKATKATLELLQYYILGLADDEDLENHINRLKAVENKKSKKS